MGKNFLLDILFEDIISNQNFPLIISKKFTRKFLMVGKPFSREQFSTKNL